MDSSTPPDTPSPVAAPVPATTMPVVPPPPETPAPVADTAEECSNNIETSQETYCIGAGEKFLVGFTDCSPSADYWVGVYEVSTIVDASDLGPGAEYWEYSCDAAEEYGNVQDCRAESQLSGVVPFSADVTEGTYQAFLISTDDAGSHVPIVSSDTFTLVQCW